jgi:hypothetical protein
LLAGIASGGNETDSSSKRSTLKYDEDQVVIQFNPQFIHMANNDQTNTLT